MNDIASLTHTEWECKYHVVFIPKYRRNTLFGVIKKNLGRVFADLARQCERQIESGSLQPDHVHMLISIPPKYSVSQVVGYIKGKSAIYIARTWGGRKKNYTGQHFWARGYYVSTVGKGEDGINAYIRNQEAEDKRIDQLHFPEAYPPWEAPSLDQLTRFERFIFPSLRVAGG